jgi:hypothetical protein
MEFLKRATIQSDGSTASTGTYRTGGSTNNNHGTAKRVGTSSSVLENSSLGRVNVGVFASTVIDGDYTDKAISGGTIAHDHVKPIVAKVTAELGGVASSALSTTANVPSQLRSINKRENYRSPGTATAFRAGYFSLYTGRFTTNPTGVTETPGTDNAASPTRSVPGSMRFKSGAPVAIAKNYPAKNG